MEIVYRNFDGLDVAFMGQISEELCAVLTEAREAAGREREPQLVEWNGIQMHVAETGATGGYSFRCDTGFDGATWFFKKPHARDPWGLRVSCKSLSLALYGLGGTRQRIYEFIDGMGLFVPRGGESIGRVDYCIDVFAPDFEFEPSNIVCHSRFSRTGNIEIEDYSTSGRATGIRVGKMPGKQVAIYDKRADLIAKRKKEQWEIYNSARRKKGKFEFDPAKRELSQIWRIEFRAGKNELKDHWQIRHWKDLDEKFGDLCRALANQVRYAQGAGDTNRARWPNHPLWNLIEKEIECDLAEMISNAEPNAIREVIREQYQEMLEAQIVGTAITYAAISEPAPVDSKILSKKISDMIERRTYERQSILEERFRIAQARYQFAGR